MLVSRSRFLTALAAAAVAAASRGAVVHTQSTERAMYVSVLDKDGKPVTDLRPDEFVIRENGVRREVLRASRATQPLDLALIIDNSQASSSFTHDLRDSVRAFVRAVGGANKVALIGAGERPTVLQDYTAEVSRLEKGVDRLFTQPGSGAYVLQAIIETARGIQRRDSERPVIVVVSTDGPEFSERYHDLVLGPLQASGAALHVLFLTSKDGDATSDAARERGTVFDRGTKLTGGRYDTVLASQALTTKLGQVAAELTNQYIVTYARPPSLIAPDTFEAGVTRQGLTARGTLVRTRGGTK
jgi:VWFA-related protein